MKNYKISSMGQFPFNDNYIIQGFEGKDKSAPENAIAGKNLSNVT